MSLAIDWNRLEPYGETKDEMIRGYQSVRNHFRKLEASGNPLEVIFARTYWVAASEQLERLGVKVNMHAPRRPKVAP
ncbi:MAG: hypothetical protein KGL39_47685 [Patescibacteria group bacterium]|nr:hypothetical protein [Patescibacteria group bacterium]